jgi:hypothetical protein
LPLSRFKGSPRYWRIIDVTVPGTFLELSELQFLAGATVISGTYTSNVAPTNPISRLSDGLLNASCYWTQAQAQNAAFYIQIDAGAAGASVNGVKQGGFDNSSRTMTAFTLQSSVDGLSWVTVGSKSGLAYPGNNTLSVTYTF